MPGQDIDQDRHFLLRQPAVIAQEFGDIPAAVAPGEAPLVDDQRQPGEV